MSDSWNCELEILRVKEELEEYVDELGRVLEVLQTIRSSKYQRKKRKDVLEWARTWIAKDVVKR